jgi:hypothetical protein
VPAPCSSIFGRSAPLWSKLVSVFGSARHLPSCPLAQGFSCRSCSSCCGSASCGLQLPCVELLRQGFSPAVRFQPCTQFICPWSVKPVLMFVLFVSCHFKVSSFDPSDQWNLLQVKAGWMRICGSNRSLMVIFWTGPPAVRWNTCEDINCSLSWFLSLISRVVLLVPFRVSAAVPDSVPRADSCAIAVRSWPSSTRGASGSISEYRPSSCEEF